MRQIQSANKSAASSPFAYPQKPSYKTAHGGLKQSLLAQNRQAPQKLVAVIAALLLVYVAVVWAKVFFKLARLTRNGLFKAYIFVFFIGELMQASGYLFVFSFLFIVASFIIYVVAWVKTDKVGEANKEGLFIY